MLPLHSKFQFLLVVFALLTFGWVRSATDAEIVQSQDLKRHLELLKGHLEEAIQKLDHNIRTRQTIIDLEVQTPDNEYIEAALGRNRHDLISAAAIPSIPLPSQTMRINQNSGLRRRRHSD